MGTSKPHLQSKIQQLYQIAQHTWQQHEPCGQNILKHQNNKIREEMKTIAAEFKTHNAGKGLSLALRRWSSASSRGHATKKFILGCTFTRADIMLQLKLAGFLHGVLDAYCAGHRHLRAHAWLL